jgi:large subunit ribosomal protein L32e
MTSKMRLHKKYRISVVRVGFRGPKNTRGLHSSGFEEVFVFNVNDLTKIDPSKQAARIGGSVGTKKRLDIQKKAEELNIRILNL